MVTAMTIALIAWAISIALAIWWAAADRRELRDREVIAQQWEVSLEHREVEVRRREHALQWAERTPKWVR